MAKNNVMGDSLDNARTPRGFKNTNAISENSKKILSARKRIARRPKATVKKVISKKPASPRQKAVGIYKKAKASGVKMP